MTISLWLAKETGGEVDRDCSKLYLSATRVGVLLIAPPPISDLCVGQPCHSVLRAANSEAFRHTRPYVGVAG
jgi:hypothetical protein